MSAVKVKGMVSPDCMATVSKAVKTVEGVEDVHVNLATGEVTYGLAECVDISVLREAVEKAGYDLEDTSGT